MQNFSLMKAQLISIGNELLIGDTVNTNASWMGQFLNDLGIEVTQIHTISDDYDLISSTIQRCMLESNIVITTGGLGPTHDDITKTTVAELFDAELIENEEVLQHIKDLFKSRNIPFSSSNSWQAMVPRNCEILFNKAGTAPGMWFYENECHLVVLPGVPNEMKYLMEYQVLPKIKEKMNIENQTHTQYLKIAGIGESTLSDHVLGELSDYLNDQVSLAFLPSFGRVTLRITGQGKTENEAIERSKPLINYIYKNANKHIYGDKKNHTLSERVGKLLIQNKKTIATAESCTGGLIANTITDIPGSSAYILGGIVSYSNSMKVKQLGVLDEDLIKFGAVSKNVALQMARGVAETTGADIGISTTGIAGPSGGSDAKPVGTVWIGYYSKEQHFAVKALFTKDRFVNKQRTMIVALEIIRRCLSDIEELPYLLTKDYA